MLVIKTVWQSGYSSKYFESEDDARLDAVKKFPEWYGPEKFYKHLYPEPKDIRLIEYRVLCDNISNDYFMLKTIEVVKHHAFDSRTI